MVDNVSKVINLPASGDFLKNDCQKNTDGKYVGLATGVQLVARGLVIHRFRKGQIAQGLLFDTSPKIYG